MLAVALATSLLAPVAVAAPAPNAPRAGQAAAPLTNLAHLDFLSAQVAVPNMAAHSTYRLAQDPRVGVLWVYAHACGKKMASALRQRVDDRRVDDTGDDTRAMIHQ